MKKQKVDDRLYQCPTCGAMHEEPIPGVVNAPSPNLPGLRSALWMVNARSKALGDKLSSFEPSQELAGLALALEFEIRREEQVGKPRKKTRKKKEGTK